MLCYFGIDVESGRFNQNKLVAMPTQTIGLFEAKTHFSELVARAEQGHEVIITRHNKPVAKLVPLNAMVDDVRARHEQAVGDLVEFRKRYPLRGLSPGDLIDEGRKH